MHMLKHSLLDVVRILPFLFLTYLFLEWLEHKAGSKMEHYLEEHSKLGVLVGSVFGLVPECGFSSAASSLYTTRVISAGALISVYLSTSDEMLPILISNNASFDVIGPILLVKVIVALIAGFVADAFFFKKKPIDIEHFCEEEHCHCEDSILTSAIKHTLTISFWLFVIILALNLIIHAIGLETLKAFILNHPTQSVLTCTLIGMIPSCASSVMLSTLYLDHVISFASVCAGLLANAGVGMMILFRVNHNMKENFKIVGYVSLVSLLTGLLLEFVF